MQPESKTTDTVLLTGFGPFPGCSRNPTAQYAGSLAVLARRVWPHTRFVSHIFPTEWQAIVPQLDELNRKYHPSLALHFGVSSNALTLHIERYAQNYASSGPDNAGISGCGAPIRSGAPQKRQTDLPCYAILTALRKTGIQAKISTNAGTYLCNFLYYNSLAKAQLNGNRQRTGFIHIPARIASEGNSCRQPNWRQLNHAGLIFISHGLQKARFQQPLSPLPNKLYKSPTFIQR